MDANTQTKQSQLCRTNVKNSDIIPEDVQNELMMWRDVFRAGGFAIGRIAVDVIADVASRGLVVEQERIFKAIGFYCGKSARTIRYYYETVVFYPDDIGADYPTLPFSYFVFARTLKSRWKEVLDYAAENQHVPLEGLKHRFLAESENSAPVENCGFSGFGKTPIEQVSYSEIYEDSQDNTDRADRHAVIGFFNGLAQDLDRGISFLTSLDDDHISKETRARLSAAFAEIRDCLPDLVRHLV